MSDQQVKRRRVTRACDECRKKKVKCDGQQPCIHCTVYAFECTYNQPTKRSATSGLNNNNNNNIATNKSSSNVNAIQNTTNRNQRLLNNANFQNSPVLKANNDTNKNYGMVIDNQEIPNFNNNNSNNNSVTPAESMKPGMNIFPVISNNSNTGNNTSAKRSSSNKLNKLNSDLIKYQQLLNCLIPNLPPIDSLDIPTFQQIVQNFKGHSMTYLEDAVKEYHLISRDSVSPTGRPTPRLNSPDLLNNKNGQLSSTNSVGSINDTMDGTSSNTPTTTLGREIKIMLPPKNIALHFVEKTWKYCCVLLRFYHRPLFIEQLNELYETDPSNYTQRQINFLPLCYSIMAVGALFSKSLSQANSSNSSSPTRDAQPQDETERKLLQDEGYKYFIAARKLIDITNTRDLNSIQTVVMLFIFLQCSARLSTCYAYIGVAMRSVLREGYHRLTPANSGLNPIEIEVRKRLFYTIYKLDIYVNAMLGLPRSISVEDFDQTLPIELSDENITVDAYLPENQHSVLSSVAISNHHTKLIMILNEIVTELYPIKRTNNIISHETVTNLELKLKNWVEQLPNEMIPNAKNIDQRFERANKLLHLSFLHVQIILYRPFIHYVSHKYAASVPDPLSLQRARNCINVSRTVVKLGQEMLDKSLIAGSYWYANYTIFYSVAGLLFYTHEAEPSDKESAREYYDILKDAENGRNLLLRLKDTSMAANRTYNILNKLFEKLNNRTIQLLYPWDSNSVTSAPQTQTIPSTTSSVNYSNNVSPVNAPSTGPESSSNTNNNLQFNYNSNQNELLTQSLPENSFDNIQPNMPAATPDLMSDLGPDKSNMKLKPEDPSNLEVLNVFDQLDAQLFGKYIPGTDFNTPQ